ncbi:MAG: family 78 glycoside hydrolase catalytic domain [Clostridia bacterium]|nr:family 78 glycoside hydrolase catalytic domain [Clostridia bacterium]
MYTLNKLLISEITVEHMREPLGIDCAAPRFAWKLLSDVPGTRQASYRLMLWADGAEAADTGIVESDQSIEVTVPGFTPKAMTRYLVQVTAIDNHGCEASLESRFETGRMGVPFAGGWVEPEQEPTPSTMEGERSGDTIASVPVDADGNRTFEEFRPAQYVRIPFVSDKPVRRARVYATAHGLYRLEVNGACPDERWLAPENTAYNRILNYQTYDVTALVKPGENAILVTLADGWWVGRVGTTGDCCQYGDKTALLLNAEIEYMDGTRQTVTGEDGVSATGPIVYADLFVGEKFDARKDFDAWKPVKRVDYPMDSRGAATKSSMSSAISGEAGNSQSLQGCALVGQRMPPVRPVKIFEPVAVFTAPNGDTLIDAGQIVAGVTELSVTCEAGREIKLEHFEVLDRDGNYFNSILNTNKEQTDVYITRDGAQTWHPCFTYHGFRYVRVTGWPGEAHPSDFRIIALASEMDDIGRMTTSDPGLNQLLSNIRWSQLANTISIPTDCPQREKAGWTGDIMAFAPTLCFNRNADAFLSSWLDNLRAEQLPDGAVPMIVPYLKAYATFLRGNLGTDTSCGWGDAVIIVPYALYRAYGDARVLEENYSAMTRWMDYIDSRAKNCHPEGYDAWDDARRARSRFLWNTDFHFGDWLIPSIVLGNPDAMAMNQTAYATMGVVAPAYYAFSAKSMAEIAAILGRSEEAKRYADLYEAIREAFIAEYVHDDGTMDADFQGIYVIALQMGLVPDAVRPKMVGHLVDLIERNGDRLDTGFLSVPFLMDVLTDNGREDVAWKILFQTDCPSWLYEVEKGGTTMWESWGAIAEDGTVSTYSYNHYAFGCVEDWMVRHIGGLQIIEPGYKKFRVKPSFTSGLTSASVSEDTPYGVASVEWRIVGDAVCVHVEVPVNAEAVIELPDREAVTVGSGSHDWLVPRA